MKTNYIIVSINFRYGCSLYKPCFTLKLKERKKKKPPDVRAFPVLGSKRNKHIYTVHRRTCIIAVSSLIDALLVGLNNSRNKHCFSIQPTHTKYQLGVPIVWSQN